MSESGSLKAPSVTSSTAQNQGILKRIFSGKPSKSRSTSSLNTTHTKSSGPSEEDQGYETTSQSNSFFQRFFRYNSRSSLNNPSVATSPPSRLSFYLDQSLNCEQLGTTSEIPIDHVFPENGPLDALPDKAMNLILQHLWHEDKSSVFHCRLVSKSMKSRVDRFVLTVFHYPNSVMCLATLNVDNGDVLFWRAHQSKLVDILSVADLIRLSNIHTSAVDLYLEGSEMHNIALVNTFLSSKFPFNNANIRVFARSFDFIMSLPFSRLLSTNSNWTFWLIEFQAPNYATSKAIHTFEFENTAILVNFYGLKKFAKVLKHIKDELANQSKVAALTERQYEKQNEPSQFLHKSQDSFIKHLFPMSTRSSAIQYASEAQLDKTQSTSNNLDNSNRAVHRL